MISSLFAFFKHNPHACGVDDENRPRSRSSSLRWSLQPSATGSLLVSAEGGRSIRVSSSRRISERRASDCDLIHKALLREEGLDVSDTRFAQWPDFIYDFKVN
jgi:hypothetical protein